MILYFAIPIFGYWALPWLYAKYCKFKLMLTVHRDKKIILTFDDGPSIETTEPLLELLEEYDTKAIFFVIGQKVPGNEEVVKKILSAGHEVGTHGYWHIDHWKTLPHAAINDLRQGLKTVKEFVGRNKKILYRPPYGRINFFEMLWILLTGQKVYMWTHDSGDTWKANKRHSNLIANKLSSTDGAVVLIHDFKRSSEAVRDMVLEMSENVLRKIKEKRVIKQRLNEVSGQNNKLSD